MRLTLSWGGVVVLLIYDLYIKKKGMIGGFNFCMSTPCSVGSKIQIISDFVIALLS
jgi:hypothetical protein